MNICGFGHTGCKYSKLIYNSKKTTNLLSYRLCINNQELCTENYTYRYYSNQARRPGFISKFVDNIKHEMQKNKEMKESLKKFREEAGKLEQSDALKSARQKFQTVESEASKSSEVLKEKIDHLKGKVRIHNLIYLCKN